MGGSDEPSNIVELTVEEHANAHKLLFEKHGRWQDEIAWKTLSGQISGYEARYIAHKHRMTGENHPNWGKKRPDHSAKLKGKFTGKNNPMFGKTPHNKGKHDPNGAANGKKAAHKIAAIASTRFKIVRPDGSWYWGHKTTGND